MSEQIREQVSAFLDGELPDSETDLLLKRLTRDPELRESFGRYALMGECLRGGGPTRLSQGFHSRVNRAIDGEPQVAGTPEPRVRAGGWWGPFAGAAVAAGVAVVAVVALQQRAALPGAQPLAARDIAAAPAGVAPVVQNAAFDVQGRTARPTEAVSYTVPAIVPDGPAAMPAARLTNYVFAHSRYSSVMGQNDVLNDLLSNAEAEAAAGDGSRDQRVAP